MPCSGVIEEYGNTSQEAILLNFSCMWKIICHKTKVTRLSSALPSFHNIGPYILGRNVGNNICVIKIYQNAEIDISRHL